MAFCKFACSFVFVYICICEYFCIWRPHLKHCSLTRYSVYSQSGLQQRVAISPPPRSFHWAAEEGYLKWEVRGVHHYPVGRHFFELTWISLRAARHGHDQYHADEGNRMWAASPNGLWGLCWTFILKCQFKFYTVFIGVIISVCVCHVYRHITAAVMLLPVFLHRGTSQKFGHTHPNFWLVQCVLVRTAVCAGMSDSRLRFILLTGNYVTAFQSCYRVMQQINLIREVIKYLLHFFML